MSAATWLTARPWRVVALAFGVLALGALVWGRIAPEPSGPPSSSYATAPSGAAAWASLLERRGRRVVRVRDELADARLDPEATTVLLDPGPLQAGEREALTGVVRAGGRLVLGGDGAAGAAGELLDAPPRQVRPGPERAVPLAPVPEAPGPVQTAGQATFAAPGEALPVLGAPEGDLVVLARAGRGELVLLADSSPVLNRRLDEAANAALALALAPRGRPVAFVESVHGFGAREGLAALPDRWKALLAVLALAALVLLAAHARRLGPPETPAVAPAPSRRAYVDALGRTLRRTGDPRATAEPLRRAAHRAVLRRGGLAQDAPEADVRAAALRLGLDEDEARVVAAGVTGPDDMLVAGRAAARLRRGGT